MKAKTENPLKQRLEQRAAELRAAIRDHEPIEIERGCDPIDSAIAQSDRDAACRDIDRLARQLAQVERALERIDKPDFGVCVECGERIAPKRLAAIPWAERCLGCQVEHEAQEAAVEAAPLEEDADAWIA